MIPRPWAAAEFRRGRGPGLSFGRGRFVVAVCGEIMLMPGLPKNPVAEVIDIDADGNISGLF